MNKQGVISLSESEASWVSVKARLEQTLGQDQGKKPGA